MNYGEAAILIAMTVTGTLLILFLALWVVGKIEGWDKKEDEPDWESLDNPRLLANFARDKAGIPDHAYCRPAMVLEAISAEEFDPEWKSATLTYQKPRRKAITLQVMYLTTKRWNTPKWRLIRRHKLQKLIDRHVTTAIINGYYDISGIKDNI